ncbi:MAG: cytochrome c oxidase subunit I [Sulfobacillus sp.]
MASFFIQLMHQLFPPSTLRPMELDSDGLIVFTMVAIVYVLARKNLWRHLWAQWLCTVDHKKIGIMYLIGAMAMLFRGGVDALLMRTQLLFPHNNFLGPNHYNEIFTTHGTEMVFFMAMPFIFALFNIVVPLQLGARDVAFPRLNAISFWLYAFGALLFNISFVVGGSPDAGWTNYAPYTELLFDHGVGENYYLMGVLVAGIGTTATGINFLATTLAMRAPGMNLMKMPLFCWSTLVTCVLIIFAFPPLTVALTLTLLDRLFGSSFFTISHAGMPMMYVNLFWLFGHPEVYILILPAFGIFSEVVPTFSGKRLYGYSAMVLSLLAIMVLSYGVWVHHFFTMGAGPTVNVFYGLSTMLIAIPTGVKIFNWIFTMWGGRIRIPVAMLWQLAFIPTFVVGGATGVMLGAVPGDYQYHNSYFLVAHFHNVLIGGTLFGLFSGLYYWWPKMTGTRLSERHGKWIVALFVIGFWICFFPQYLLGLEGMTRRLYTYPMGLGWTAWNQLSSVGAYMMGAGFIVLVYSIATNLRHAPHDVTGDPWNGRTLEWSTPSPAPEYNFSRIPCVTDRDAWWEMKQSGRADEVRVTASTVESIEVPTATSMPFLLGLSFFVGSLGMVFQWWAVAILGGLGIIVCLYGGLFSYVPLHTLDASDVLQTETKLGRINA